MPNPNPQRAPVQPHRRQARALPALDPRPHVQHVAHAELVVARQTTLPCAYCGVSYGLGDPTGSLINTYPRAESRYWAHCLIEAHQAVLRERDATMIDQLVRLPTILTEARQAQHEALDPARKALKRLLT